MSNKENNLKEKFKQALISTAKVISGDFKLDLNKQKKNSNPKKIDFFDVTNLSNRNDFIRLRAETDSTALKKKFSDRAIFDKNLPHNPSYRSLYSIAEKVRYEVLGGKMLKGVGKNIKENYIPLLLLCYAHAQVHCQAAVSSINARINWLLMPCPGLLARYLPTITYPLI